MADRVERDLLGERAVPEDALWGIHALRARENFPLARRPVHPGLIRAYGAVKLACVRANMDVGAIDRARGGYIAAACEELMTGQHADACATDALQGGAGTSTNMAVNEIIANRACVLAGRAAGDAAFIDPLRDVNRHQSTNDTYPAALHVAAIAGCRALEPELVALLGAFQDLEKRFAHVVKIGRTQLQDAVPTTLGRAMAAYAEAIGRDRWRVYKCEERLRVVALGGTAIGTGLGAPRRYIFAATEHLRAITGYGLARAENLIDPTQNHDALVEVSGILKACATNLVKIGNDLRLLASGPDAGFGELRLPPRQAGSSIMPGKVNPVIPEAVVQAGLQVMGNDAVIGTAVAMGNLELNAFLPLAADRLLDSLDLLARASRLLVTHCLADLQADEARCAAHVHGAVATLTVLAGELGYQRAEQLAVEARAAGLPLRRFLAERGILGEADFDRLTTPEAVTRLGSVEVKP